jgi:uncharacterized protein (TIGR03086 family)
MAAQQPEGHRRAHDAFASVLSGVRDDQLDSPTPCSEWAVRDLIVHVIGGSARLVDQQVAAPSTVAEALASHRASADAANAVFADDGAMERVYELPFGNVPGTVLVHMMTSDALAHAWDLAQATGQASDFEPELAAELLVVSRQMLRPEMRREGGPFGPEQTPPPDAPPLGELAAFFGRRPMQAG